ncbi:type III effector, partial [Pseudomonas syringae pv. actinidiae]|nr:type III effector [Pseudomonas syringae pv. actinidiae]
MAASEKPAVTNKTLLPANAGSSDVNTDRQTKVDTYTATHK